MTQEEILWMGTGIILVILEFILPGLVAVFLGSAAILVGLMIHFDIIHGVIQSFGAWFGLSIFLILTIRQIAARFLLSDSTYKYTEEDEAAIGQIVNITETIHSNNSNGRIRFQGTDWPARAVKGTIKKGDHAIIKYRDNISWVVEPHVITKSKKTK